MGAFCSCCCKYTPMTAEQIDEEAKRIREKYSKRRHSAVIPMSRRYINNDLYQKDFDLIIKKAFYDRIYSGGYCNQYGTCNMIIQLHH